MRIQHEGLSQRRQRLRIALAAVTCALALATPRTAKSELPGGGGTCGDWSGCLYDCPSASECAAHQGDCNSVAAAEPMCHDGNECWEASETKSEGDPIYYLHCAYN